jgi:hypothetical protein
LVKWIKEVKETVTDWLNGLAADFYDQGIIKFVQHLGKWLNHRGNYAEKQTNVVSRVLLLQLFE